jgi:hypothetical protein
MIRRILSWILAAGAVCAAVALASFVALLIAAASYGIGPHFGWI